MKKNKVALWIEKMSATLEKVLLDMKVEFNFASMDDLEKTEMAKAFFIAVAGIASLGAEMFEGDA